jgi:hypothetical protein
MNWKIVLLILLVPLLTLFMSSITPRVEKPSEITGQVVDVARGTQIVHEQLLNVTEESVQVVEQPGETLSAEDVLVRDYELVLYNYAVQFNNILNRARTARSVNVFQDRLWELEASYDLMVNHSSVYADMLGAPEHVEKLTKVNDFIAGLSDVRDMLDNSQSMLDVIRENSTGEFTQGSVAEIPLEVRLSYVIA